MATAQTDLYRSPFGRVNEEKAGRVKAFIEDLPLVSGDWAAKGKKMTLMPWQAHLIEELFGRVDDTGKRQYVEALVFVPRKAGKSATAAALALWALFGEGEIDAQVVVAARDRNQASHIFKAAADMVERSPDLKKVCRVYRPNKRIVFEATRSTLFVISADAYAAHGLSCSCAIIDELHTQRDRRLFDALKTSQGARREPILLSLTTAGDTGHRPTIARETWEHASRVRDGLVEDPQFLPMIFEASEEDKWDDPATWAKAQPSLGVTVPVAWYAKECERAKATPAREATFRQLYLNQWVGSAAGWIRQGVWEALEGAGIPEGEPVVAGLDVGAVSDLTSLALLWTDREDTWHVKSISWVPRARVIGGHKMSATYQAWVKEGWLIETPGEVTDYETVLAGVLDVRRRNRIEKLAIDEMFQAHYLSQALGNHGLRIWSMGQSMKRLGTPTRVLEERILEGRIRHDGNPVLAWSMGNVALAKDHEGNIRPSKKASDDKIDPVVAMVMAADLAMRRPTQTRAPRAIWI